MQACGLRDLHSELIALNTVVLGVSQDDAQSHANFIAKYDLPFALLVDVGGEVRNRYGNPDGSTPPAARASYVIDAQGQVQQIVASGATVDEHLQRSVEQIKLL